jgi:hypothetical protein
MAQKKNIGVVVKGKVLHTFAGVTPKRLGGPTPPLKTFYSLTFARPPCVDSVRQKRGPNLWSFFPRNPKPNPKPQKDKLSGNCCRFVPREAIFPILLKNKLAAEFIIISINL